MTILEGNHDLSARSFTTRRSYTRYAILRLTALPSTYAVLRDSGYSGLVVIDAADTDAYVAARKAGDGLLPMLGN